jgi:hypothetical protein
MPNCGKCGKKMDPEIDMTGDVAAVLKRLSSNVEDVRWKCEKCGTSRSGPLRSNDVDDVRSYVRRQKKQWWQFWIR